MSSRNRMHQQSTRVAFCGMAAALSLVMMMLGGIIPIATYAVPMLCGLILLPILLEFGKKAAWTTFLTAALLALLTDFDKEAAFFYLFIGFYPIVKWRFDRIRGKGRRLAAKLLLFTGLISIMYGLLYLIFPMEAFMQEFREMGIAMTVGFILAYDGCMLLYDRLLLILIPVYAGRIQPRLKFLHR